MTQAKQFDTAAHRLLDDLDTRHDQLLVELDALSARVDQVLSQYTQVRPEAALPAYVPRDEDEPSDQDDEEEVESRDD